MTDSIAIERGEELAGTDEPIIAGGGLARGDGGFNPPWNWHIDPASAGFFDAAIELCDGCPQMVEDDLDYWVDTVGAFCPWSSRVIERVE